MGQVFLTYDPVLERHVAIKLLHPDASQSALREEARAIAALRHAGIVQVFEIGEHEGRDFIAMEYLPGRSLRQVLLDRPPRQRLLAICLKIVAAVDAAHRAGILHRDLKPENVVVAESDDVTVVDFGLARRLKRPASESGRMTQPHEVAELFRRTIPPDPTLGSQDTVPSDDAQIAGTPAYMAPEVMCGDDSTAASDVYSIGIILYECLVGQRPYAASSLVALIASMIEEPPAGFVDPLAPIVIRMLARDPAQRPSLAEVRAALEPPPAAAPISATAPAHPSSSASRLRSRSSRSSPCSAAARRW